MPVRIRTRFRSLLQQTLTQSIARIAREIRERRLSMEDMEEAYRKGELRPGDRSRLDAEEEQIRALRKLLIPVAVATYDGSAGNQEFLVGCGADDVIVFPIPGKLLEKRLEALSGSSVFSQADVDFSAFDRIREANQGKGSFIVQQHDFANIYRFVMRLLERLDQKAQLIIFTFTSDCGPVIESEGIMNFLRIVQACLRRGDISSVCGRQVFMILIGADELGGHTVIQRVLNAYAAHFDDDSCEITFEMREISSK